MDRSSEAVDKKPILQASNLAYKSVLQKKRNFGFTGATGLLGRNIVFEIIKQNLSNLSEIRIVIFGRSKSNYSLQKRIEEIFLNDGLFYLQKPNDKTLLKEILKVIYCVEFDFGSGKLDPSFSWVKSIDFDCFFHLAAMSDFRRSDGVKAKLFKANVKGTEAVVELIDSLSVGQVVYTGTAYSCGSESGLIQPEYTNLNGIFRNHYELTKLMGEKVVVDFSRKNNIPYKIFRPVGICGRAIEPVIGQISKYDLFYAWASFFVRLKMKEGYTEQTLYSEELKVKLRLECNTEYSLNVVPVDYAAKLLLEVSLSDFSSGHFHICNDFEINNLIFLSAILNELKITGVEFLKSRPRKSSQTELEKIYYKSVGEVFSDYLTMAPVKFDMSNLFTIKAAKELNGVPFSEDLLKQIVLFAKQNHFGVRFKTSTLAVV